MRTTPGFLSALLLAVVLATAAGLARADGLGSRWIPGTWVCEGFETGPCTLGLTMETMHQDLHEYQMPMRLVARLNYPMKVCFSEEARLRAPDLAACASSVELHPFAAGDDVDAAKGSNGDEDAPAVGYASNYTYLLPDRRYRLQAYPLGVKARDDGGEPSDRDRDLLESATLALDVFYTGFCPRVAPHAGYYGGCDLATDLTPGAAPRNASLTAFVPLHFRLLAPPFLANMTWRVSSASGAPLSSSVAWLRKGLPAQAAVSQDYDNVVADGRVVSGPNATAMALTFDDPPYDASGWFLTVLAFENSRVSVEVDVVLGCGGGDDGAENATASPSSSSSATVSFSPSTSTSTSSSSSPSPSPSELPSAMSSPSEEPSATASTSASASVSSAPSLRVSPSAEPEGSASGSGSEAQEEAPARRHRMRSRDGANECRIASGAEPKYHPRLNLAFLDVTDAGDNATAQRVGDSNDFGAKGTSYVLIHRGRALRFGLASADFEDEPPNVYAAVGYVPNPEEGLYAFVDQRPGAERRYLAADAEADDATWYVYVRKPKDDWVFWNNAACPSNCSGVGTCDELRGRCDCPRQRYGADCSLSDSVSLRVLIISVCAVVAIGALLLVLLLFIRKRRALRTRFESA